MEDQAGVVIVDGRYFVAIWQIGGEGEDWLGTLYSDCDGPWVLTYRTRHHVDDKILDSDDVKDWGQQTWPRSDVSERQAEIYADRMANAWLRGRRARLQKVVVRSDVVSEVAERLKMLNGVVKVR